MFNKNKKRKITYLFFSGLAFVAIAAFSITAIITSIIN